MNHSISVIENYLNSLDKDINHMLSTKDLNKKQDIDALLLFLEQAEHNLFFILEALKESILKIRSLK